MGHILHDKIELMGLQFDSITMDQCVETCINWCSDDKSTRTLVTVNAALLMMMHDDMGLADAIHAGDLVVADGLPVVWASRIVKSPLIARVAGIDLMQNLLIRGDKEKLRVYFLGAKQEVLDSLVVLCSRIHPNLVIAGVHNGYFDQKETSAIVQEINSSNTDILLLECHHLSKKSGLSKIGIISECQL